MARHKPPQGASSGIMSPAPVSSVPPLTCEHCRHWTRVRPALHSDPDMGQCRRYPPSVPSAILSVSGPLCKFPLTLAQDACGEYAPRTEATR